MSHIEYPTPDYAGRVPAERRLPPQSDMAAPPPAQPSEWLQPIPGSKPPEHEPGEDQETYVIMPEEDAAPKRHASVHGRRPQGRLLVKPAEGRTTAPVAGRMSTPGTAEQRLLVLDTWMRSGLPAGDFAPLVGVSKHTLYAWKTRFEADGPAGLQDRHRGGPKGSRLSELTKRAILRMKESNPDWGVERISDLLLRTDALAASPPQRWRRSCMRPATCARTTRCDRIPTRSASSSGRPPMSCGRPICSPSCSSGRTSASTWWPSWTITPASSSPTACTPANRRRWSWRPCVPGSSPMAARRRC
jgi:transposase